MGKCIIKFCTHFLGPKLYKFMHLQRRRRHFKSGQATTNKRLLVHVHGGEGVQQEMCGNLWNQNARVGADAVSHQIRSWPIPILRVCISCYRGETTHRAEASLHGTPDPIVSFSDGENETNNPLKSGPALAGPAGPAQPPLT